MTTIEKIYLDDIDDFDKKVTIPSWNEIKSLWGVSPVGPLHLGYDSLIVLQRKILEKNPKKHFIVIADIHSALSHGLSWLDLRQRCYYYEYYLREISFLKHSNYILGSYFQTRPSYVESLYSLLGKVSLRSVMDTLPAYVKKNNIVPASVSIYSLMQCLDVFYLETNFIVADRGQEKIYDLIYEFYDCNVLRFGTETNLKEPEKKITFLYIPIASDIKGRSLKESSSETRTSIHDSKDTLEKKIDHMYAPPYNQMICKEKINACLEFFKYSVFPWIDEKIKIVNQNGVEFLFENYRELEKCFYEGFLFPNDLKKSLKDYLWKRLQFIQNSLQQGIDFWVDKKRLNKND